MRKLIVVAAVGLLAVACSSSSSGSGTCTIEGSYTGMAVGMETGNCPTSTAGPVTDTIMAHAGGNPDFTLQITGTTGACVLNRVAGDACKVQGKCDIAVADAIDPNNATGTIQYAWTFDSKGFTGTSTIDVPPAKSLPMGCMGQSMVQGTRQ